MFMQDLVENVFSPYGVTVFSTSVFNSKLHRTVIWAVDEREARRNGGKNSCPSSCSFSAEWTRTRYVRLNRIINKNLLVQLFDIS